jgi:hypothetical protein
MASRDGTGPPRAGAAPGRVRHVGKFEFTAEQTWTVETLVGFASSTSLLNRHALGELASEFERDLGERLGSCTSDGTFRQSISYAYELERTTSRS